MRKNQWFKWFIIEIDKTIQQAADGRVCLRKKLTKNGLLLLDKTRFSTLNDFRRSPIGKILPSSNILIFVAHEQTYIDSNCEVSFQSCTNMR